MDIPILLVPIRLDALIVDQDRAVVGTTADFSRLPYWIRDASGKVQDFNSDVPFLSESILSEPLEDQGLYLRKGVHLHWTLPDLLTRSRDKGNGTMEMPAAPNRWLVRKSTGAVVREWVVESDYLHPPGATNGGRSIIYPVFQKNPGESDSAALTRSGSVPWRCLGRAMEAQNWIPAGPLDYLPGFSGKMLTVLGWGDPNFGAFYPNCHSVFGYHDEGELPSDEVTYEVIGWHADAKDDLLNPGSPFLVDALAAVKRRYADAQNNVCYPPRNGQPGVALQAADIWQKALEREWQLNLGGLPAPASGESTPRYAGPMAKRSLYYAKLILTKDRKTASRQVAVTFGLGNTGTEALSAWLARQPDVSQAHGSLPAAQIEDRLESVGLAARLASVTVDGGFKFREARHEKGFAAVRGGQLWTVRKKLKDELMGPADGKAAGEGVTLPAAVAHQLNALNDLQQRLDRASEQRISLQRRLYADWCLYQKSVYPPEDERESFPNPERLKYFIQQGLLPGTKRLDGLIGRFNQRIGEAAEKLRTVLGSDHELKQRPGPRFWRPTDPVILMAGTGITPTPRHGEDGFLPVCRLSHNEASDLAAARRVLASLNSKVAEQSAVLARATTSWTAPWHPYLLEWEAEILPVPKDGNLHPESRSYAPGFITENFAMSDDARTGSELQLRPGKADRQGAVTVCTGRCLLTPHAGRTFAHQLALWLHQHADKSMPDRKALADWAAKAPDDPRRAALARRLRDGGSVSEAQVDWIELGGLDDVVLPPSASVKAADFESMRQTLKFLRQYSTDGRAIQSQSLGGFHEALLGQEQVFQLPVADPLGFPDMQALVDPVSQAVGGHNRTAPLPLNDFLPIRTGFLRLIALRLVDTFGQVESLLEGGDLSRMTVANAASLTGNAQKTWAWLPPRFAQAARVNFRWLSADWEDVEMNAHPASSPICGWLVPNRLDGTLQVHAADGRVLGILGERDSATTPTLSDVVWQPRPGNGESVYPDNVPNRRLRQVVNWIIARGQGNPTLPGPTFYKRFLDALDSAQENIHPAEFRTHDALALLMGRPIAVVRASVSLSVQGLPAANHSWSALRRDLRRSELAEQAAGVFVEASGQLNNARRALLLPSTGPEDAILTETAVRTGRIVEQLLAASRCLSEAGVSEAYSIEKIRQAVTPIDLDADQRVKWLSDPAGSLSGAGFNLDQWRTVLDQLLDVASELQTVAQSIFRGWDRTCDNFAEVKIPLRVGEFQQLNDGLYGYWIDANAGKGGQSDPFFATQATTESSPGGEIRTHHKANGPFDLPVALADPPRNLTFLMDPRGVVHLTSGVLPTKSISLPPDQYTQALKSIQLFFLSTPVLTPKRRLALPVPKEEGSTWTWLTREPGTQWLETNDITPPPLDVRHEGPQVIVEGWLRLDPKPATPPT